MQKQVGKNHPDPKVEGKGGIHDRGLAFSLL